jgi:hypothetical protein
MQKKWLLFPAAAVAVGAGVLLTTASAVSAHESRGDQAPHQRIIQLIEHKTQRLAALETTLSEAVAAGRISEQQKQLILEKMHSLKDERLERKLENRADRDQRRAEMEEKRADLEAWAQENGIDLEFLKSLHEGGPRAGQHLRGRFAG